MEDSVAEGTAPGLSPLILACLAATWLIWGSTYLAIKWALISLPPFFQIPLFSRWEPASSWRGRS